MVNGKHYFAPDCGDSAAIAQVWASQRAVKNTLRAGQSLNRGGGLASANGMFVLAMQNDGNLVLSNRSAEIPTVIWKTGTTSHGDEVRMQKDGNLIVESSQGAPLFKTGTHGHDDAYLLLLNNGSLSLYWSDDVKIWEAKQDVKPIFV